MDEIKEAVKERCDYGYYGLILKCMDEDGVGDYWWDNFRSDCVELYEMDAILEMMGRVKQL